jgi:hypothetical protein
LLAKSHILSKSGLLQDGIWFVISYKYFLQPFEVIICQNNYIYETAALKKKSIILKKSLQEFEKFSFLRINSDWHAICISIILIPPSVPCTTMPTLLINLLRNISFKVDRQFFIIGPHFIIIILFIILNPITMPCFQNWGCSKDGIKTKEFNLSSLRIRVLYFSSLYF